MNAIFDEFSNNSNLNVVLLTVHFGTKFTCLVEIIGQ
jgi:hypothetical protein